MPAACTQALPVAETVQRELKRTDIKFTEDHRKNAPGDGTAAGSEGVDAVKFLNICPEALGTCTW